jgi:trans-aconitate methyltransferase
MTDDAERTRNFWIDRAHTTAGEMAVYTHSRSRRYDAWTRAMLQTWTLGRVRAAKPRYARCLDLGCGHGDWTEAFATLADEVFACDVAPSFVDQTRRRVPHASVACADLRSYRMPDRLDLVYVGAVLMHLTFDDALDVLLRVRNAANRDALVIVRDWCTFNLGRRTENPDPRYFSVHRPAHEVRRIAELAGLTCVELRSSPSIYGEVMARHACVLQWPLRALWRLSTLHWLRASHTLVLRA